MELAGVIGCLSLKSGISVSIGAMAVEGVRINKAFAHTYKFIVEEMSSSNEAARVGLERKLNLQPIRRGRYSHR